MKSSKIFKGIIEFEQVLDRIIQFEEKPLSKAEMKRQRNEKGSSRSRTLDALATGGVGALTGGTAGAAASGITREGINKLVKFDPFKNFRPGFTQDSLGSSDRKTIERIVNIENEITGDKWKNAGATNANAFQQGSIGREEKIARQNLQKKFIAAKRMGKFASIGAAAGLGAGAIPMLMMKPKEKGQGREAAGKQSGAKAGATIGSAAGILAGLRHLNPATIITGAVAGSIGGGMIGGRVGGAIGARRDKHSTKKEKNQAV